MFIEIILMVILAYNIKKHALLRQQKPSVWIGRMCMAWILGDLIGAWFLTMMFNLDWGLQIELMQKLAENFQLTIQEQDVFDSHNLKILPSVLFGLSFGLYIRYLLLNIPPNNSQNNSPNNQEYFRF